MKVVSSSCTEPGAGKLVRTRAGRTGCVWYSIRGSGAGKGAADEAGAVAEVGGNFCVLATAGVSEGL